MPESEASHLVQSLAKGQLSAERLTRDCLSRASTRWTRHGPRLNSVIELNPQALAIAKALDADLRAGAAARLIRRK